MLTAEFNQHVQSLAQQGQWDQLLAFLHDAARRQPQEPDIHHLLGWVHTQLRQYGQAIVHFRDAIHLKPDAVGSLNNLGLLLLEQEKIGEAIEAFKAAVGVQPTYVDALTNLGLALCRANLCDHALFFLEQVLKIDPRHADAHHYLGFALLTLGRTDDADRHLAAALEIKPGTPGYLSTLGLLREKQHRAEEATVFFEQAVKAGPEIAEPWNNLGNIQAAVWGNYPLALEYFNKTLAIRPLYADARYHRGMVELSLGDFERGWADYESRPTTMIKARDPRYSRPRWRGEPLANQTIVMHCEQGLGDTLQFIRFAQRAKVLGATVICEVQKKLIPLLKNTPGIDSLIEEGAALPPHDYQIPLMSMATILGIPPMQQPYLFASSERVEFWKERIAKIPGVKIGIAWQGEPVFKYDWLRSIALAEFAPLARLPGHSLISLQKFNGVNQIAANREQVPVVELEPEIDAADGAFMDTAAIMMHLDLVITSDSAIAHLAGGLGVPVWLATMYAPDWRWMIGREDSPWYASLRLFRQTRVAQWKDVFTRMAQTLATSTIR